MATLRGPRLRQDNNSFPGMLYLYPNIHNRRKQKCFVHSPKLDFTDPFLKSSQWQGLNKAQRFANVLTRKQQESSAAFYKMQRNQHKSRGNCVCVHVRVWSYQPRKSSLQRNTNCLSTLWMNTPSEGQRFNNLPLILNIGHFIKLMAND